jgi:RimJ/RimL family protein N-acetyltransferase
VLAVDRMHDVEFRPVAPADFPMMWRWRMKPHVRAFYQRTEISLEELALRLGPRVRGEVPTICHLALHRGEPFGYLQCYRNADWPEWVELTGVRDGISIDLHIGKPSFLHRGFGRSMLLRYLRDVAFESFDVESAYIAHATDNLAALGCSRAVGFEPLGEFLEDGVPMRLLVLPRSVVMAG